MNDQITVAILFSLIFAFDSSRTQRAVEPAGTDPDSVSEVVGCEESLYDTTELGLRVPRSEMRQAAGTSLEPEGNSGEA